ncbi:MAG: gluconate 2-dehydrogenase subunit 3 family protein [Bacteroidetes bacterium]|nr:gluconate 2-dehydrogenase subunit 3 family protein [Bacteroidota bacterium]
MKRRSALKKTAYLMGGTLSAASIATLWQTCSPDRAPDWTPRFFSQSQFDTIGAIAEQIIPETETLGAKGVGVDRFIDLLLKDVYSKQEQDQFLKGLIEFEQQCHRELGKNLYECELSQQQIFLRKHQTEMLQLIKVNKETKLPFFLKVKELTLWSFFTSEQGIKQNLLYRPVPGKYEGCITPEQKKVIVGNHV